MSRGLKTTVLEPIRCRLIGPSRGNCPLLRALQTGLGVVCGTLVSYLVNVRKLCMPALQHLGQQRPLTAGFGPDSDVPRRRVRVDHANDSRLV
jgi:hypothetical protein